MGKVGHHLIITNQLIELCKKETTKLRHKQKPRRNQCTKEKNKVENKIKARKTDFHATN